MKTLLSKFTFKSLKYNSILSKFNQTEQVVSFNSFSFSVKRDNSKKTKSRKNSNENLESKELQKINKSKLEGKEKVELGSSTKDNTAESKLKEEKNDSIASSNHEKPLSEMQKEKDAQKDKEKEEYKLSLQKRIKEIDNLILHQTNLKGYEFNPLLKRKLKHITYRHNGEDLLSLKLEGIRISKPICKTPKDFYIDDKVLVTSGEFKGQIGKVTKLSLKKKTITVEGVNTKKAYPPTKEINEFLQKLDKTGKKHTTKPKIRIISYPIPMKDAAVLSPFTGKIIKPVFEYINDEEGYVRKCPETNNILPFPEKYVKDPYRKLTGNPFKSSARSTRNKALMLKTFKGIDYVGVVQDFLARSSVKEDKEKKMILKDKFFSNEDLI